MGTHLRVLSESYPINTNMTGFGWFSKIFAFECSLSIGRVKVISTLIERMSPSSIHSGHREASQLGHTLF